MLGFEEIGKDRIYILPRLYKEFYNQCAISRPDSIVGMDLRNDTDELNDWAVELLDEVGTENFLTEKDFVFMMHQGYIFWYFKADGNENPDVYFYKEGRLMPNKEFPLKEFLENYPKRLCDSTNKKAEWDKQADFYNDLIQNYGWKQTPMIDLIAQLRIIGFCDKYFPSNSHEALGLSVVFDDVKFENPMVFIVYRSDNDIFEIHYQKTPGELVEIATHGHKISTTEFKKIEEWLNKNTKAQQTV